MHANNRYLQWLMALISVLVAGSALAEEAFRDCTDCPEMVMIPAGSFEMGGTMDASEKPVHSVRIAKPFALGRTEVTQGQWKAIMGSNPSSFSKCGDECPVETVNWNDAQEFVRKLSQKTGKSYRLPSEAEWEYACRAGGQQEYCGSESLDRVAWYDNDKIGGSKTRAVARKQANAWGLYDMNGNVWEWTEDCWNKTYVGAPTDDSAWTTGECTVARMLRGGSWDRLAKYTRAANRRGNAPDDREDYIGFRPAMTLP